MPRAHTASPPKVRMRLVPAAPARRNPQGHGGRSAVSVHVKLIDPESVFHPARDSVGERRVDHADEVVAVVTAVMAMIVAVPTVASATAVSRPRRDQDGQDGENEEELADHTALRSPGLHVVQRPARARPPEPESPTLTMVR